MKERLPKRLRPIISFSLVAGITLVGCRDQGDTQTSVEPTIAFPETPALTQILPPTSTPELKILDNTPTPKPVIPTPKVEIIAIPTVEYEILPTHTPIKEQPLWCQTCYPTEVSIPKIDFRQEVQDSIYIKEVKTWSVPDFGVAKPPEPILNNVIIFGHSSWQGIQRPFGQISQLEKGDLIIVENQLNQKVTFEVTDLDLVSRDIIPSPVLEPKQDLILTLITSAKIGDKWILDKELIEQKTGQKVGENDKSYLNLIIIAKPQD